MPTGKVSFTKIHMRSLGFSQHAATSWTRRAPENGLDLLQGLAFGLGDQEYREDDVEGAHAGEEPEGPRAG